MLSSLSSIYAGFAAIFAAEATVITEEFEEGVDFEFGSDTAVRAGKNAAAAASIVATGGAVGVGVTASVVGGAAAFDIGRQTLVEGQDLGDVDYERTLHVAGVAAPAAAFAGAGLAAGGTVGAVTTGFWGG